MTNLKAFEVEISNGTSGVFDRYLVVASSKAAAEAVALEEVQGMVDEARVSSISEVKHQVLVERD